MRKFWKNVSTSVFFIISSIVMMISEFSPWINQMYSPWDLYSIDTERVFIYLFPIISSSIIIVLAVLVLLNQIIKLKRAVISIIAFIAQSLNTLFLIEMFTNNGVQINSYNYGVLLGISAYALLFWALFWLLIQESKDSNQGV
ncbi:MAG: hypothetical protein JW776_15105 [Candidatus Lokiarchaeota archaeon]|nr:hypothetical protein [Candidatus Lokiarchaeota archaeon]